MNLKLIAACMLASMALPATAIAAEDYADSVTPQVSANGTVRYRSVSATARAYCLLHLELYSLLGPHHG